MKNLLLFLTIIVCLTQADCQVSRIDSIINDYERRYRVELNKSDTILINSLKKEILNNCNVLDSIVVSNLYSTSFLRELSSALVGSEICLEYILDHLSVYIPSADAPLSVNDYPFYLGITSRKSNIDNVLTFLLESKYLSDCFLLAKTDEKQLSILSYFLHEHDFFDLSHFNNSLKSCREANLLILNFLKNEK